MHPRAVAPTQKVSERGGLEVQYFFPVRLDHRAHLPATKFLESGQRCGRIEEGTARSLSSLACTIETPLQLMKSIHVHRKVRWKFLGCCELHKKLPFEPSYISPQVIVPSHPTPF